MAISRDCAGPERKPHKHRHRHSTVNGVANTLRPDVTGPVTMFRHVEQWFDTSAFLPVSRFGNLGRNVIIGPRFDNTDVSITKITKIGERLRVQFRAEVFDLFNHANFGPPGRVVGSASFARSPALGFRPVNLARQGKCNWH